MSGIFAIDPSKEIAYIPKDARDLPPEQQPVFYIRPLKAKESADLEDGTVDALTEKGNDKTNVRIFSGTTTLKALKMGLIRWDNFKMRDGSEVDCRDNNGKLRPEMYDFIPPALRQELAEVITTGKGMTEQEEKNSD